MKSQHGIAGWIFFILVLAIAGTGCSHTNNLEKYQLAGRGYVSETFVAADAANVEVHIDNPSPQKDPITGVLVAIGEGITAAEAQKKFERAVKPEGVAASVANGFEIDLERYLEVRQITEGQKPDVIVRTNLEEMSVFTSAFGIFLKVKAETTMIDRASAGIIWQNSEEAEVPLRKTTAAGFIPGVATGASIANAAEFFNLPEKEIQDAVLKAAEGVGALMGETLRADVAKMKK